jgi:hypothetical protein
VFISVRGKVCNSLSINELQARGWPPQRNSLRLNDLRRFLPEKIVLTVLAHRGDVELLETQRVLEGIKGDILPTSGAGLGDDRLATIHASDGGDGRLQFGSLDCRLWFPFHR